MRPQDAPCGPCAFQRVAAGNDATSTPSSAVRSACFMLSSRGTSKVGHPALQSQSISVIPLRPPLSAPTHAAQSAPEAPAPSRQESSAARFIPPIPAAVEGIGTRGSPRHERSRAPSPTSTFRGRWRGAQRGSCQSQKPCRPLAGMGGLSGSMSSRNHSHRPGEKSP